MSTKDVKQKLKTFYRQMKALPSIREFCELLGKSKNYRTQAKRILDGLVDEEFLTQNDKGRYLPGNNFFAYEFFHGVQAGAFTAASDLVDYINLEDYLVRKPNDTVVISVHGDSMVDAGINDGDLVIVEQGSRCSDGDIIVAELDGEYTVKYLQTDGRRGRYLQPANDKFEPIYFSDQDQVKIVGKVTKAIKNF